MRLILLIFCFFPYVGFGILTVDTQPWALMFSILILLITGLKNKIKLPKFYIFYLVSFLCALSYLFYELILGNDNFAYGLTSLSYYLSTPLIALAVYNVGIPENFERIFIKIYIIWLVFAIIQLFIPGINEFLVNSVRTSEARGLTSLAPEPVWYGRIVLIFLFISFYLKEHNSISKKWFNSIFCLSIFQIVVLSNSGTIFFYLSIVLLFYIFFILKNLKTKIIVASTFVIFGSLAIIYGLNNYADKRLFSLIDIAMVNPEKLSEYGGFNMRVMNAPLAIKLGIFDNNGLGTGLISLKSNTISTFKVFSNDIVKNDSGGINGGYVFLIYQIGLFAFFWIFGILKAINYNKNNSKNLRLFISFSILLILFFESSLSNPLSAFLIGLMMLGSDKKLH